MITMDQLEGSWSAVGILLEQEGSSVVLVAEW